MPLKFCTNPDCNKPIYDGGYKTNIGTVCRNCHESEVYRVYFVGRPQDFGVRYPRKIRNMQRRVVRSNDNGTS